MAGVVLEGWAEFEALAARLPAVLDDDTEKAVGEIGVTFQSAVRRVAPKRSGRLAGSVTLERDGSTVELSVTARRVSRSYPGGYPYPVRVEREEPFMRPAIQAGLPQATEQMKRVLDDLQRRWGS